MFNFLKWTQAIFMGCVLAVYAWSCESNFDNLVASSQDLPPAIFAFLNTAADSQYVIISNSLSPEGQREQFIETEYNRIRRAKVDIEGGGEQFVFNKAHEFKNIYESSRSFFVFVSAHRVRSGETYRLRVEIPEKGIFTASTTAPSDFTILVPNSTDTINVFQPLEVKTTASHGAAGYRVSVWIHIIDSTDFKLGRTNQVKRMWGRSSRYFKASDTPIGFARYFYGDPNDRDITLLQVQLSVEALDTAAWLSRDIYVDSTLSTVGGNNSGEELRLEPIAFSNIEGGRGVMTAITAQMIPLRFPPIRKR